MSRDKAKLQMLEQRLREDEQRLAEFNRIEAQSGAGGDAVKLVFPPATGPIQP